MIFVLKMMTFVLKMMNFVQQRVEDDPELPDRRVIDLYN